MKCHDRHEKCGDHGQHQPVRTDAQRRRQGIIQHSNGARSQSGGPARLLAIGNPGHLNHCDVNQCDVNHCDLGGRTLRDRIASMPPEPAAAPLEDSLENRRQFLVTKLAAGFAMAVMPVSADTITTDTNGLVAGEVKIPTSDGTIPAYRAMPHGGKNLAVVLVVQEIFGVHEHIKDICRRFAKLGYCAVAPELFARQGDVSQIQDIQEIMSKVVSKVPDAQVMTDLDATVAWAAKHANGSSSRIAITGFCWGGRIVWLYATHTSKVKAGAAWYGRLEGSTTPLQPKNPLDYAGALEAPVIGFYGGKDTGIPLESVAKMETSLKVVDSPSQIVVYPDAGHGFNADYRPSYNAAAAQDAWKKMLEFFKKNGIY